MKTLPPTLAFALKFIIYFAVLMSCFEASRGTTVERFVVEDCILKPTIELIHVAAPREPIHLVGRTISSPSSHLRITRGCEGVEIFLLLLSAIAAFPASWKAKARGLALGFITSYVLSVCRLIALHFTLRYSPAAWESLHGLILPLGPIVLITTMLALWPAASIRQRLVRIALGLPIFLGLELITTIAQLVHNLPEASALLSGEINPLTWWERWARFLEAGGRFVVEVCAALSTVAIAQ